MAALSLPGEPLDADSNASSQASSSSTSPARDAGRTGKARPEDRTRKQEEHRIIAACAGAIVTSLTMTPFDVVRIRLQTQSSESLFVPSAYVPPPSYAVASASDVTTALNSHQKGKGKAVAGANPLQHARSLAATNLATCCQKTYFTTNLADKKSIVCSFDPRETATTAHASNQNIFARLFSPAARNVPIAPAMIGVNEGGAAAMLDASACLYPSPTIAAAHLPTLTAPSSRHFSGFFDAFVKIARHEGMLSLWRGVSAALVMSVPSQAVYMVGYDSLRKKALARAPARFLDPVTQQPSSVYISTSTFVAGSLSRTAVATMLAPLELFRTRMQSTQSSVSFRKVVESIRDLARTRGVSSLWRGLSATLWRDVPFSGMYWAGYEGIRRFLSNGKGMGEATHGEKAGKTFGIAFASGAGSGMIASFVSHPFDVAKTRRQVEASSAEARSTFRFLKDIVRQEGMQGLWSGLGPRVAKVAPACGIMIGAYELGLRWT